MDDRVNALTLTKILRPLFRHWGIIVVSFLCVVATVGYFSFTAEDQFEAFATLSFMESMDRQDQSIHLPNLLQQKYLVKNQVAILESRRLVKEVIKRLQNSIHQDSLGILEKGLSEDKNDRIPKAFLLQQFVDKFMSTTEVVYNNESDIIELRGKAATPWEAALLVNTWVEVYQEYSISGQIGEVNRSQSLLEAKVNDYKRKLENSEEKLTRYKKNEKVVSLSSETDQLVTQAANFEALYNQSRTEFEALENQLLYLKDQLDSSKYHLAENMAYLSNESIRELQRQLTEKEIEKVSLESQLTGAGFRIKGDERIRQMENRLRAIRKKIIDETSKLVETDMANLNPLDYSENLINQILELETQKKSLVAKIVAQKVIIEEYNKKLRELPDKSQRLAKLEREVELNSNIYTMLAERLEETRIKEVGQMGNAHIVDFAEPPTTSVYPNRIKNMLLASIFGLLLGIGLALGREYFESSIRSEEDLKDLGLRVIGEIPLYKNGTCKRFLRCKTKLKNITRAREIYPHLLIQKNGNSPFSEAYRVIRTSIYLVNHKKSLKTILITSPGPSEGKSSTAANLAISLAKKGTKTLLVDGDLRKPVLDILFMGSHRKVGLTNVLGSELSLTDAVRETAVSGLYLLASGTEVKNAPEILTSKSMRTFIQEASDEYGIVIIDSPPLLPVTDATVLASLVDSVILVSRAAITSREEVIRATELLQNAEVDILGAVLTGVDASTIVGYQNYYNAYFMDDRR